MLFRLDEEVEVTSISGEELASTGAPIEELQEAAEDYARDHFAGGSFVNEDTGWKVSFNNSGIRHAQNFAGAPEQN